jgi:hypothetical protein
MLGSEWAPTKEHGLSGISTAGRQVGTALSGRADANRKVKPEDKVLVRKKAKLEYQVTCAVAPGTGRVT